MRICLGASPILHQRRSAKNVIGQPVGDGSVARDLRCRDRWRRFLAAPRGSSRINRPADNRQWLLRDQHRPTRHRLRPGQPRIAGVLLACSPGKGRHPFQPAAERRAANVIGAPVMAHHPHIFQRARCRFGRCDLSGASTRRASNSSPANLRNEDANVPRSWQPSEGEQLRNQVLVLLSKLPAPAFGPSTHKGRLSTRLPLPHSMRSRATRNVLIVLNNAGGVDAKSVFAWLKHAGDLRSLRRRNRD